MASPFALPGDVAFATGKVRQNEAEIKRVEKDLKKAMIRMVDTYPTLTTDNGLRGDVAFKADGTKMAIHNGNSWKAISLSDTL